MIPYEYDFVYEILDTCLHIISKVPIYVYIYIYIYIYLYIIYIYLSL